MDSEYSVVTSWSVPGEPGAEGEPGVVGAVGEPGELVSVMPLNLRHGGQRGGEIWEKQNRRRDRFQITERRFLIM